MGWRKIPPPVSPGEGEGGEEMKRALAPVQDLTRLRIL